MVKLKPCWIGTKIGVVVHIDPPIMVVVCGKICGIVQISKRTLFFRSPSTYGLEVMDDQTNIFLNLKFGIVVA